LSAGASTVRSPWWRCSTGTSSAWPGRRGSVEGFRHAIAALAALGNGSASARLVVVGDGEERSRLELLVRSLGVEERALFTGRQPARGVAAYLAAADAFLFPTERDEAAPLVLPQAMACGPRLDG
jgi:glycosyltransferase involved in cell wall biosynthesis